MTKPLSDRLTASRECDAEIALLAHVDRDGLAFRTERVKGPDAYRVVFESRVSQIYAVKQYTTSLDAAVSLYPTPPVMIPSDPLECCREALKQRGL